jgi:hypothetical protein
MVVMVIGGGAAVIGQPVESQEVELAEPLRYTRLYSDSSGESHFADEELTFELVDFAPPAPPISVSEVISTEGVVIISSPAGWYGDWHPAPRRQFMFCLSGEVEVEASDGEVRRFGPGSVVSVEDTVGKGHISRVVSSHRGFMVVAPSGDKKS